MGGAIPYAYATFLVRNDSYLPGALMLAYELSMQEARGERICFVTDDISIQAEEMLCLLFHHVVRVPTIVTESVKDQARQYLPYVFTRLHALRLGVDGDLGFSYEKVVILDADILPIRYYDHLFLLDTPAAILNEDADNFKDRSEAQRDNVFRGRWKWHDAYGSIPHGWPVPMTVTERVRTDAQNYGMNTALLVANPCMGEFMSIMGDLEQPEVQETLSSRFTWPDMQYLTMRWSGKWRNIDLSYAGMNGYPDVDHLFGTHYAGIKPWNIGSKSVRKRYSQFKDYKFWYSEYLRMMKDHSGLRACHKLVEIEEFAKMDRISQSA